MSLIGYQKEYRVVRKDHTYDNKTTFTIHKVLQVLKDREGNIIADIECGCIVEGSTAEIVAKSLRHVINAIQKPVVLYNSKDNTYTEIDKLNINIEDLLNGPEIPSFTHA